MKFLNLKVLKRKKVIFSVGLIVIIAFLGLWFFISSRGKSSESATVKKGDLRQELALSGKIDAEEHVVLQFQTGGQLLWVGVKEGDYVQKYQGIASLDQRSLQKTLEKKLNDYMTTRWNFDQTKEDNEGKIITDKIKRILDKSQFELNNAVLDVELQSLANEFANLWTPINGIVTRIDTPLAGVNIIPTQSQFEVVNPQTIFFDVNADQSEVVSIHKRQSCTIVFDSYPDEKVNCAIKNISFTPKKDETETVYKVKIGLENIDNNNYKYRLGMTGDSSFVADEKFNVLYLPSKFIKSDDQGKYVFVGKDKKKTYVQTGMETDTDIEITGGLNEGDTVYD